MRINVYAEERSGELLIVERTVDAGDGARRRMFGLRVVLDSPATLSPATLHDLSDDDDRSAVTVWFRSMMEMREWADAVVREVYGLTPW